MGRVRETVSAEIETDIDTAYHIVSDHVLLHKITPHIMAVKVMSRRSHRYLAEETLMLGGRRYMCMIRHHCSPPHTHEYFIVGGDAKGSHIIERFKMIEGRTYVTVDIHWKRGLLDMLNRVSVGDDYIKMLCAAG